MSLHKIVKDPQMHPPALKLRCCSWQSGKVARLQINFKSCEAQTNEREMTVIHPCNTHTPLVKVKFDPKKTNFGNLYTNKKINKVKQTK